MTTVSYASVRSLSLFDAEDLSDEEIVLAYRRILTAAIIPAENVPTIDELISSLISENFYLPKLIGVDGVLGFVINSKFRQWNINFSDGEKLVVADKKSGDPDRYVLRTTVNDDTFETSVSVPDKTKTLALLNIVSGFANNPPVLAEFIGIILPEAVTSTTDGTYKVTNVQRFEKYASISLSTGLLLRTNAATPDGLTEITVINSFIYCSREGKPYLGISLTGKADNLLAVSKPEIGDVYTILGVSTNKGTNDDYHVAKLRDAKGIDRIVNSDSAVALKATKNFGRGKVTTIKLTGEKPKTGNMSSAKPIWAVVS